MSVWRRSTVWVDAFGRATTTKLNSSTGATSVVGSLQAMSNASVTSYWESVVTTSAPTPTAAQYPGVSDRVAFVFLCADTTNYVVVLPAPIIGIFQADGETVDLLNVSVVAFAVAAIAAPLCNNSGSPVTVLLSGTRLPFSQSPLP